MNWFERNVNQTAVIISLCAFLFTCGIALFAMGFNLILVPYLLDLEFKIYLTLAVFFAVLSSFISILWVVHIKNSGRWLLIFFAFSLASSPILFILSFRRDSYFDVRTTAIGLMIFSLLALFWLIGLILLISSKNKQGKIDDTSVVENVSKLPQGFNRRLALKLITLAVIALVISGISFIRTTSGYQLFTHERWRGSGSEDLGFSQFSFKCPKSYFEYWGIDLIMYPGEEIILGKDQIKPFVLESTQIQINVSPHIKKGGNPDYPSLTEQCIFFYFLSFYGDSTYRVHDFEKTIKNLSIKQATIDGIPAEYATFSLSYNDGHDFTPVRLACFERNGIYWAIRLVRYNNNISGLDSDFENLIGSFKITD